MICLALDQVFAPVRDDDGLYLLMMESEFEFQIELADGFCLLCAARSEEADWIDLNTVQGYRRMVFCECILDEVKLNLRISDNDSDAVARRVLEAICRNRLAPTTWLNKVRRHCFTRSEPELCQTIHIFHASSRDVVP